MNRNGLPPVVLLFGVKSVGRRVGHSCVLFCAVFFGLFEVAARFEVDGGASQSLFGGLKGFGVGEADDALPVFSSGAGADLLLAGVGQRVGGLGGFVFIVAGVNPGSVSHVSVCAHTLFIIFSRFLVFGQGFRV